MEKNAPHLVLIDGYGFVFRAYHSMPPLTRSDGTPVGAVLGFTNMLLKCVEQYRDDHVAVILDAGEKNFRNDLYSEYKANRPPAPEDLKPQFPLVREAASALSLPVIDQVGYEADDIIATYAHQAKAQGYRVTIVSSDKDLMQLVDETQVQMFDPMKSKKIGVEQVVEKFGVPPEKLLDVLSLMGDASDNVPGVPGIGPKIAAELILTYGSLEALLESTAEIKQPKRRQSLETHREEALLSKRLIRLEHEVPVPVGVEALTLREFDRERFLQFLEAQNFRTLAQRFKNSTEEHADETSKSAVVPSKKKEAHSLKDVAAMTDWLGKHEIEQLYLQPLQSKSGEYEALILGVNDTALAYLLLHTKPVATQASLFDAMEEGDDSLLTQAITALEPYMRDPSICVIAHDIKALLALGCQPYVYEDLMLMSYVLGAGQHGHSLSDILAHYHNEALPEYNQEALEPLIAAIGNGVMSLYPLLKRGLTEMHLWSVYRRLERPLIAVISAMEQAGITVDPKFLQQLSTHFGKEAEGFAQKIHQAAGEEFNIASPKQLGEILFDKLQLAKGKKSKKTGAYSTGADVLMELASEGHELANWVLQWRQIMKLKTTYTDALPQDIAADGRIHTHFAMAATSTGRLSSYDPNLQNIPIRSHEGNKIREAFIAQEGFQLVSADYSQIELRLLAHVAQIETLQKAFAEGKDIHAVTASEMFGQEIDHVSDELRRQAKMINFGIIYGISSFGLAHRLGISRSEAKAYIEQYFKQYPGIRHYMDETVALARRQGWVETIFGRRCYVPAINDRNPTRRQFSERAAINAPLQGAAADIIKKAMIAVPPAIEKAGIEAKMLLQVHDELIFEVPEAQSEALAALVKKTMEQVATLRVPLEVGVGIGRHWAEIH